MKTLKTLLCFILISNSLLLSAQLNPVSVDLRNNGIKLDAKFYPANKTTKSPSVILLHGFPGNQSSPLGLAERLNTAGLNILVFNYQGSYLSEGNFSFDNSIDNVNTALEFLLDPVNQTKFNIDTSKLVVCGYSFGGTIAIESAMYNDKIKNIISIANDDHSISIKKATTDLEFRENYRLFVGKSFEPSGPFRGDLKALMEYNIQNVDRFDLVKNAEKLKLKKVLFVVGWQDNTSLIEVNILPLYRKLLQFNKGNTSIIGFEADHRFSNVIDEVSNTIINWIINNAL
jgi:pimeloyl-ACP methyl ester carboxylesterase